MTTHPARLPLAADDRVAQLGSVSGVGPKKLERYGEAVLEVLSSATTP